MLHTICVFQTRTHVNMINKPSKLTQQKPSPSALQYCVVMGQCVILSLVLRAGVRYEAMRFYEISVNTHTQDGGPVMITSRQLPSPKEVTSTDIHNFHICKQVGAVFLLVPLNTSDIPMHTGHIIGRQLA